MPVKIAACDYVAPPIDEDDGMPAQPDALRIGFVNTAPLVATEVRLVVQYAKHTQTIDASGHFTTGALIDQHYAPAADATPANPARCRVEAVTYADGSRWPSS